MSFRLRLGALLAALLLVETASFWKLSHWLQWMNEPWLAYVSGLAFVALLLSAIVALGSPIPDTIRRQFYIGGVWLFLVQAISNVLVSFSYGLSAMPVQVVTQFFNITPALALTAMAVVEGATLSVVSVSFWSVLGHLLRQHAEEKQEQRQRLASLQRLFQEEKVG